MMNCIDMSILVGCSVCPHHGWHLPFISCGLIFSTLPAVEINNSFSLSISTFFFLHIPNCLFCTSWLQRLVNGMCYVHAKPCGFQTRCSVTVSVQFCIYCTVFQISEPDSEENKKADFKCGISTFCSLFY